MNFVENNGKKVAAVLCVASCLPVVATVYAMETQPGWHGDKYVNEDRTVAKSWQEIEGKSYYFSEDNGSVEIDKTRTAVVATVSSDLSEQVQEEVEAAAEEAFTPAPVEVTETEAETPVVPEEVQPEVEAPVVPEEVQPEVETPAAPEEVQPEVETPAAPEEVQPEVETPAVPEVETPAPEVTPEPEVSTPANPYEDLNNRIVNSAISLVGVTDGQWCTQVAQGALAGAGVSDAQQLWPDQYAPTYGYYTDTPTAGNLIYYNNGGRGVDHIAIYIGDGQAVHGMYNGQTVIASVNINGGAPQYIQVVR